MDTVFGGVGHLAEPFNRGRNLRGGPCQYVRDAPFVPRATPGELTFSGRRCLLEDQPRRAYVLQHNPANDRPALARGVRLPAQRCKRRLKTRPRRTSSSTTLQTTGPHPLLAHVFQHNLQTTGPTPAAAHVFQHNAAKRPARTRTGARLPAQPCKRPARTRYWRTSSSTTLQTTGPHPLLAHVFQHNPANDGPRPALER